MGRIGVEAGGYEDCTFQNTVGVWKTLGAGEGQNRGNSGGKKKECKCLLHNTLNSQHILSTVTLMELNVLTPETLHLPSVSNTLDKTLEDATHTLSTVAPYNTECDNIRVSLRAYRSLVSESPYAKINT